MNFRIADLEDAEGISLLEEKCFALPWTKNVINSEFNSPHFFCFVATEGCNVCGYIFASCTLGEGEIERIAVDEKFRRRGIADELMQKALKKLLSNDVKSVFLEVGTDNDVAISLYRKHGFNPVGVRKRYYENTKDALIMNVKL